MPKQEIWRRAVHILFSLAAAVTSATGTSYYVDDTGGSDSYSGTATNAAWQSITNVSAKTFVAGDRLYFKAGGSWTGRLTLNGNGAPNNPIVVDQYGVGAKPFIDGGGYESAVLLLNVSYWELNNLEIINDGGPTLGFAAGSTSINASPVTRYGIYALSNSDGIRTHLYFNNLNIHHVFPEDTSSGEEGSTDGHGISVKSTGRYKDTYYDDVRVLNCQISYLYRFGFVIGKSGLRNPDFFYHKNITVRGNTFYQTGGSGAMTGNSDGVLLENNVTDWSGYQGEPRMWNRGSGYWPYNCRNVLVQSNQFKHARGIADSCGMHTDSYNDNVLVQYNLSYDNEGGFVEVLSFSSNVTYRYNISINDGARINGGAPGGKMFFILSAENVSIYNNTVYVSPTMTNLIQINQGAVEAIQNNIFMIEGESIYLPGAGTNPGNFNGNLWYGHLPVGLPIGASDIVADPMLANPGGTNIGDYVLNLYSPAIHAGAVITNSGGRDYRGTPLPVGPPCLGALEQTNNHPPVATAQSIGAVQNTARGITLTGRDFDSDSLSFSIVTNPVSGTLTGAPPNVTYKPATNYIGADSFVFMATDSRGATSSAATVSITVAAVNQPPFANAGVDQSMENSDGSGMQWVTLIGTGSSDYDGTLESYVWKEGATQVATGVTATVSLPTGTHTLTLTVTDNNGAAAADTVIVTVVPVNVLISHTFDSTGALAGASLDANTVGASAWFANSAITADGAINVVSPAAGVAGSAYVDLGSALALGNVNSTYELEIVLSRISTGTELFTGGFWKNNPTVNNSHDSQGSPWWYWRGNDGLTASTGLGASGDLANTTDNNTGFETFTFRLNLTNATLANDSVKFYEGTSTTGTLLGSTNFSGDEGFRYVGIGARTFASNQMASAIVQRMTLKQIFPPPGSTNPVITATAGTNGTIFPSGAVQVASGIDQVFTITPDAHYHIVSVAVDGTNQGAVSGYTFTNVTAGHTIQAAFAINTYTLEVVSAHGTPSPNGVTTNVHGTPVNASINSPIINGSTQYVATGWTGTGSVGSGTGTVVNFSITNDTTLTWRWQTNIFRTIIATAGTNGSISPSGTVVVTQGSNQSFAIIPAPNCSVLDVMVDGSSIGAAAVYTFTNVMADHTINATFALVPHVDAIWTNTSSGNWLTDANWDPGVPGSTSHASTADTATFGAAITNASTITVDANRNISGISFAGNSFAYTLTNGNLLLTSGGFIQTIGGGSGSTNTIGSPLTLGGDATFTAGSSTTGRILSISGGIAGVATAGNTNTLTLNGSNTGANIIGGVITNGAGGGKLAVVKEGSGTWTLTRANTFTGDFTINSGKLLIGAGTTCLGNPTVARNITVNSGGVLDFAGRSDVLGGVGALPVATLVVNSGGVATNGNGSVITLGKVTLNGGAMVAGLGNAVGDSYRFKDTVTVGGSAPSFLRSVGGVNSGYKFGVTVTFNVADVTGSPASDLIVSGELKGTNGTQSQASGFIKAGAGTMELSNTNLNYVAPTTVSNGTLLANGILGTGAVTVASGGTLGGSGTIRSTGTVSGAVSPGSGGIGTLTTSNITWNGGVAWPFDLGTNSSGDQLNINGTFTKGTGSGFAFDLQNTGAACIYTLVTWSAATDFASGDFSANNVPGGLTPTFAVNANELTLTLAGASLTGFDLWASAITNGLTNFNESATQDGYANLLKYATGSSPTQSDNLAQMSGTINGGMLIFGFNRNTNATDVTLFVEGNTSVTNDLAWVGITTNIHGTGWNPTNSVSETGGGSPVSVTVQDTMVATNAFMRLRVTRP